MELTVKVKTPQETITFSCEVHHTISREERLIDHPFYEKYSPTHAVPEGDHHELELNTPVWDHPHAKRIHSYRNPSTGRNFVCVTTSLPTIAAATGLFQVWCLGTAYTMMSGEDFGPLFNENDPAQFRDEMKKRGIEIATE